MSIPSFIFGGDTRQTQEGLKRQRAVAEALFKDAMNSAPHDLGSGLSAVGKALLARSAMSRANDADAAMAETQKSNWAKIGEMMSGGSALAYSPSGGAGDGRYTTADVGASAAPLSTKPGDENIYGDFIDTVKNGTDKTPGLTNPYALAAVAATGKAESGYSDKNAYGAWSDPSESGQAGTAGGIMSWRAGRLASLRDFASASGDDPRRPSARTQAAFFLQENPQLTAALQGAKSVEEAQGLMNNAWAFAGHDRPGGEAARRLSTAKSYLSNFMDGPQASAAPAPSQEPVQVASLDPSIGMDSALAYNPRAAVEAPSKDKAVAAALAPLPAPREVAANPTPPKFSPAVMAAMQGDAQFDGFGRDGGNVRGAPAAPSAPDPNSAPAPVAASATPRQAGMNLTVLMQMMSDPTMSDEQRQVVAGMLQREMKPKEYGFSTLPDGTILRQDPRSGTVEPIYQGGTKPTYGVIGKDQFGTEQYGWIDPGKRSVTPANGGGAPAAPSADANIPAPPPGIDPKEWRKQFSERAAIDAMPAKDEAVTGLRKEIQLLPSYKNFSQAAPIYRAMTEAAGRDTKSADLNLVYGLGKIMDPGSVVREGEIVMANDTQGIADKLNGFIAGIQGEGRLRPEARQQIMQEAFGRLGAYQQAFNQDAQFYTGIASRNRIPVEDVIPNFGTFEEWKIPNEPTIREVSPAAATPQAPAQTAPPAAPAAPPPTPAAEVPMPAGMDPSLWKIATPEERRLWQNDLPQQSPAATVTPDGWQVLPNGVKIRVKQ